MEASLIYLCLTEFGDVLKRSGTLYDRLDQLSQDYVGIAPPRTAMGLRPSAQLEHPEADNRGFRNHNSAPFVRIH